MEKIKQPISYIPYIIIVFLCLAPFDWPYAYYQILKIITCLFFGINGYLIYQKDKKITFFVCAFAFLAILYNPFEKIGFTKQIWTYTNLLTSIFIICCLKYKKLPSRLS